MPCNLQEQRPSNPPLHSCLLGSPFAVCVRPVFTRPFRLCGSNVNLGTTVRQGSLHRPRHESRERSWRASPGLHRAANTGPAPRAGAPVRPRPPGRTGHPLPRRAVTARIRPGLPGKASGRCPPRPLRRRPPNCCPHHLRPDNSPTHLLSASFHKPAYFRTLAVPSHTRLLLSRGLRTSAIPRNGHPLLSPPLSPHHLAPALLRSPLRPLPPKPWSLRSQHHPSPLPAHPLLTDTRGPPPAPSSPSSNLRPT